MSLVFPILALNTVGNIHFIMTSQPTEWQVLKIPRVLLLQVSTVMNVSVWMQ